MVVAIITDDAQHRAEDLLLGVGGLTRYRFQAEVRSSYRQAEWLAQVGAHRAVAYTISCNPAHDRFYLDASFTPASPLRVAAYQDLLSDPAARTLAVDHNRGFLAPALLDRFGNPVGRLPHIALVTEDRSAWTRDGHLRQAITDLLDLAEAGGARSITIEDLGFSEMRSTGREQYGSRRWFRSGLGDADRQVLGSIGGDGLQAGHCGGWSPRRLLLDLGQAALAGSPLGPASAGIRAHGRGRGAR